MSNFIPYPFYHDDVPIDISFVFEDEKPAGKHGFLKVDGKDFVFEDGTKVKFWGTNFNGWGCFPEHDYAEKLAKRLAKIGINLVRFHQLDAQWHTPNIFSFTKGKRVTNGHLDPQSMDRLDYLIYCLKNEGIYCYMDMFTYRKFKSDEGVENAKALSDAAKCMSVFSDKLIELQKEFCVELWTHENPYTKMRYADDPVFVMAEVCNECDLFSGGQFKNLVEPYKTEFINKFAKWLDENGYEEKAEDFDIFDFNNEILIDFKIYLQEHYYKEMISCMRDCGLKFPLTGNNWQSSPANAKTQLLTDYFDGHAYHYSWSWKEFEKRCANNSITKNDVNSVVNSNNDYIITPYSYLWSCAVLATENKPTFVSEWDMPWPNHYRAESVLYSAALGLLQGWSGFAIHTYSYSSRLERMNMIGNEITSQKIGGVPYRQGVFSAWNDPAKFGLFYHAALMTRRGDVSIAKNTIKVKPFSRVDWNHDEVMANIEKSAIISDLDFKEFSSRDDKPIFENEIISDTGELLIDRKKNYGYINTPMTKCAYGFLGKNGEIDLSGVKINCDNDFAVVAMSSLTDEDIKNSDNILLTTVGRAQNTDAKFMGDLTVDQGKPPITVEVIKAEIEIETDVDGMTVWAISPEGFYIGTVPATYENRKLKFTVGNTSQSMYYLIVKE